MSVRRLPAVFASRSAATCKAGSVGSWRAQPFTPAAVLRAAGSSGAAGAGTWRLRPPVLACSTTGHPETALYVVLFATAFVLSRIRRWPVGERAQGARRIAFAAILAVSSAQPLILPAMPALAGSMLPARSLSGMRSFETRRRFHRRSRMASGGQAARGARARARLWRQLSRRVLGRPQRHQRHRRVHREPGVVVGAGRCSPRLS